jgi:putative tryptophan/tyrosine transport system substrate-binding protein
MIARTSSNIYKADLAALRRASGQLGFELAEYAYENPDDLEGAFASGVRDGVSGFYISGEVVLLANISRVVRLVAASGKPSVGVYPDYVRAGLLMSYGIDPPDGVILPRFCGHP